MTTRTMHLSAHRLHVLLDSDCRAVGFFTRARPADDAISGERLALTFDDARIEGTVLYLDGPGFVELAGYIVHQRPRITPAQFGDRMMGLFPGDPHIMSMMRAVFRANMGPCKPYGGEAAWHVARVREQMARAGERPLMGNAAR